MIIFNTPIFLDKKRKKKCITTTSCPAQTQSMQSTAAIFQEQVLTAVWANISVALSDSPNIKAYETKPTPTQSAAHSRREEAICQPKYAAAARL